MESQNWSALQKNAFRFFFLFLSASSIVGYNMVLMILNLQDYVFSGKIYGFMGRPVAWFDRHLFNIGYDPAKHAAFYGDGYFGWALLPVLIIIAFAGAVIWAIADRKRPNYNKLHYWFRTYLAYYLFFGMIIYAVEKIIPVQMPYPNVDSLIKPLGENGGFDLVWNFIGARPAYSFFTGCCELLASLLVLSRRTRVFGSLFMATVLVNVVCFNFFYNVPVKLLCSTLLLADLFLMAPYIPKLFNFFYRHQPVSLAEKPYRFTAKWKNYMMIALLIFPAWVAIRVTLRTWGLYRAEISYQQKQRLYDVSVFIKGKDTLPPLLTDTIRWKRFALTDYRGRRFGVIYNMKDASDWYAPKIDSVKKTITLTDDPDTSHKFIFHYTQMPHGRLALQGTIKGNPVKIMLDSVNTANMPLNKEKIKWLQDY